MSDRAGGDGVRIRLLGHVALYGPDGHVELGRPQQRCVFAALALTPGQTVPAEALVDRVWGTRPPRNGRTALYSYVSRLRGLLRLADPHGTAALRRRSGGYALEVAPELVDLHRSRGLAQQARATSDPAGSAVLFAEACAPWSGSGSPLGGISGEWADRARTALTQERVALLVERFDAALRADQHESVVGALSEAAAAYPLSEALSRLLMVALYRSGNQADALAVFTTLRRRLVDELGDEPGIDVRRLHEQILRRDPALTVRLPEPPPATGHSPDDGPAPAGAPWVPLCQLPPSQPHLVGRDESMDQLLAALRPPPGRQSVPVAALTGPPGVGKTALAIAVAHRLRDEFPDGQWYVHAGDRDPGGILTELLEASGMDSGIIPDGLDRRAAALRARLADRRVMLLVDDAAAATQLRPLLPGTSTAAVLVTSRNQLAGMAELSLSIRLESLTAEAAADLVGRVAGTRRVEAEPAAIAELCRRCDGLPLALRIAAARLAIHPEWTIERLARNLRDHRHRLDELAVDDVAVRPGLHLSYESLDVRQQVLLRNLAALGDHPVAGWTLRALGDEGSASGEVGELGHRHGERLAEALVRASLLDNAGTDPTGEPRYRLHGLVAAYAAERAEAHPEQVRAAVRRQLDGLLTLADAAYRRLHVDTTDFPAADRPLPGGVPQTEAARLTADPVAWLLSERGALVAAIESACDRGWHADAAALADRVLAHVLRVHIGPGGIRALFERIRDSARAAGDALIEWRAEARLCTELAVSGQVAAAADRLRECATAFEAIGARAELAFSLGASATYQRQLGGGPELLPQGRRALAIARECGVKPEIGAIRQLALLLAGLGRRAEALPLFTHAVDLATREGLVAEHTVTLLGMASAAYAHGDLEQAETTSAEAMELVDGSTDPRGVAYLLLLSARVAARRERHHDAMETAQEAAGWFAELGDVLGDAMVKALLGQLWLARDHPRRAVPPLEEATATLHSIGMFAAHADTLATLTAARVALGDDS